MLAIVVVLAGCKHLTIASRRVPVQVTPPASATVQPAQPALPPGVAVAEPVAPPAPAVVEIAALLPPGPVPVGLLLPLSGPSAELGEALFEAAQLALFDVGNEDFVLLPRDTQGTPEGAARAAASALADGAALLLGPLFSGSVAAVAPHAQAAGVNVIAFSSDRAVARQGVYLMGFLPAQQVERVVSFAANQGVRRVTALAPSSAYGQTVVNELRRVAQATGIVLVDPVFYPADAKAASDVDEIVRFMANYDVRRQALMAHRDYLAARDDDASRRALRRLEGLDTLGGVRFDAVLLPEGGPRLLTVAPLFPYYDLAPPMVRLLGTEQWETATLEDEPALIGGWFTAPPPETRADFTTRFAETFGRPPPRLATLAYDAVALAGALARRGGRRGFGAETLTSPDGFRGVDGLFRFAPDGANERGFAVLEVTAKGPVTVSEAPKSFGGF